MHFRNVSLRVITMLSERLCCVCVAYTNILSFGLLRCSSLQDNSIKYATSIYFYTKEEPGWWFQFDICNHVDSWYTNRTTEQRQSDWKVYPHESPITVQIRVDQKEYVHKTTMSQKWRLNEHVNRGNERGHEMLNWHCLPAHTHLYTARIWCAWPIYKCHCICHNYAVKFLKVWTLHKQCALRSNSTQCRCFFMWVKSTHNVLHQPRLSSMSLVKTF